VVGLDDTCLVAMKPLAEIHRIGPGAPVPGSPGAGPRPHCGISEAREVDNDAAYATSLAEPLDAAPAAHFGGLNSHAFSIT
jgi:hypothetical protein